MVWKMTNQRKLDNSTEHESVHLHFQGEKTLNMAGIEL